SSRRRHTISTRDWSSDVCSSDLEQAIPLSQTTMLNTNTPHFLTPMAPSEVANKTKSGARVTQPSGVAWRIRLLRGVTTPWWPARSEERRVGKERSRGWRKIGEEE